MTVRERIQDAQLALEAALQELASEEDTQEVLLPRAEDDTPPVWLTIAYGELGQHEAPGDAENPRIHEYHAATTLGRWAREREATPWCSSFVNWVMREAGIEGTGSAMARSWLGWGLELRQPRPGCVTVLRRGAPPSGHVGFFERAEGNLIYLLGGNQGNAVSVKPYGADLVLGYRWPAETA